eukprot:CAMPEP_0184331874 /NCGR_PEP_ID=MMETSP1089-20130417/1158_1 /TAXON_ID=38269 ORGANISM="Gloeochaete wittrockiana, Strain SAG46.84" /NCGR_SAMPLE_ID=MMETSP1089 /ASSEMBLY_ACC=CAM_ASM_000445 /LENGTH=92 /DNA_ID=CAMNT_0026655021 /DNA_START=1035 /DNA_END=1313 /DNA_ORIENTATION=-
MKVPRRVYDSDSGRSRNEEPDRRSDAVAFLAIVADKTDVRTQGFLCTGMVLQRDRLHRVSDLYLRDICGKSLRRELPDLQLPVLYSAACRHN